MSGPLRITHLASGDRWAGAEVATAHLLRALAARAELRVRLVVLNPGELADRVRRAGVETIVEAEARRPFPALLRAVRRHLDDADLVHTHRYKENLLAGLSGRPWVATQHGRPEPFRGLASLRMAVVSRLDLWAKRRSARRVIAVSGEIEDWLAERIGAERVTRVWNGIEDPATAPRPWAERPRRVGAVARLDPVKGLELAVDAVARCPGLELEVLGEGPARAALERRAAASGAGERIRFLGFEADPLPRIAGWRALLLPSLHEGNPISVLEALALGTPVVAAPLPGVAEILDGRGGWLQPGRDAAAWARALGEILDDDDGGERASASARARFLEAFTAAHAAERVAGLYRELLEASASATRPATSA